MALMRRLAAACLLGLWAGCSAPAPAPVDPIRQEAEFRARRLDAPEVRTYVGRHLGRTPDAEWDLDALTLVAFFYHPDLDVARARWAQARAAVDTARTIPNPSLSLGGERSIPRVPSPWLYGFTLDLPLDFLPEARLQDRSG